MGKYGKGCAMRSPMKKGERTEMEGAKMELPDGKTCQDCIHCKRCCLIFGHIPEDEVCDFYPSLFREKAA
jgi:hypothetical protein